MEKVSSYTGIFLVCSVPWLVCESFEKKLLEYCLWLVKNKPERRSERKWTELFSRYRKTGKLNGMVFDQTGMASVLNLAHAWV